jgi:hypothetical protein
MRLQNPNLIRIKNREFRLNTDFRNWLKICAAFDDNDLEIIEQRALQLRLAFLEFDKHVEFITENMTEFYEAMVSFLRCFNPPAAEGKKESYLFDFQEDWENICAAYAEKYGADLKTIEYLHWFDFMSRFQNLSKDSVFMNDVAIRGADLNELKGPSKAKMAALKQKRKLNKQKDAEMQEDEDFKEFERQHDTRNLENVQKVEE